MKRRELLQLGIGGLAALGTKGSLTAAAQPGSGQGPLPPKPPAPDAVVNLTAKTVEDWSEPWIWRPSEWPNQPLALNVVGNAHPPRATSTGNPFHAALQLQRRRARGRRFACAATNACASRCGIISGRIMGRVPKGPAADPFEVHPDALAAAFCRMQKAAGQPCAGPPRCECDLRALP